MDELPEIASSLVSPLSKIDKMVMINGDGDLGASKVTAEVARVMAQVPDVVESLTGVQLKQMLAGIDGKVRPPSPLPPPLPSFRSPLLGCFAQ